MHRPKTEKWEPRRMAIYLQSKQKEDTISEDDKRRLAGLKDIVLGSIAEKYKYYPEIAERILELMFEDIDRNWQQTWRLYFQNDIAPKAFGRLQKRVEHMVEEYATQEFAQSVHLARKNGRPNQNGEGMKNEYNESTETTWEEIFEILRKKDEIQRDKLIRGVGPIKEIVKEMESVLGEFKYLAIKDVEICAESAPQWPFHLYDFANLICKDIEKKRHLLRLVIEATKKMLALGISTDSRVSIERTQALAYNELGIMAMNDNTLEEAEEYFKQSQHADPYFITPFYNMACVNSIRYSEEEDKTTVKALQFKKGIIRHLKEMCEVHICSNTTGDEERRLQNLMQLVFREENPDPDLTPILESDLEMKEKIKKLFVDTLALMTDSKPKKKLQLLLKVICAINIIIPIIYILLFLLKFSSTFSQVIWCIARASDLG